MNYKSKRSKATDIPQKVKREVYERDNGLCIFCGKPGMPNAHVVPRSQGGLGVPKNIVTACVECHRRFDSTTDRKIYLEAAKTYLRRFYGAYSESEVTYKKGET